MWIENEKGMLVKNLFVTDFTAGKGWEKRPESLPSWRKAVKDFDIDGISSATPKSGKVQLQWDIKNENGEPVAKGIYKIFIEANIKWENTVLFTCEIKIDDNITIGEITEKISGNGRNLKHIFLSDDVTSFRKLHRLQSFPLLLNNRLRFSKNLKI